MKPARALAVPLLLAAQTTVAGAASYGGQEHVRLIDGDRLEIVAQLDARAPRSLLYAYDIHYANGSDGKPVASFTVDAGSVLPGDRATITRPVLHDMKLNLKNGARAHRPMVNLRYCLGDRVLSTDVELIPRTGYLPSLLLGADALAEVGSVDPQKKFTVDSECPAAR